MKYNPDIHHRRSIRLKGYDYSQEGLYFATICTQNREHLFGTITNGKMQLNPVGEVAHIEWFNSETMRPNMNSSSCPTTSTASSKSSPPHPNNLGACNTPRRWGTLYGVINPPSPNVSTNYATPLV